jgi:hypothetical protein
MQQRAKQSPLRRKALVVALIALSVLATGFALSTPVWQCETMPSPSGIAVVSRDCRHVPRSRALWTWLTEHVHV